MDCDLQHPPEKAVEMYRLWQEGYQVVEGVKASRGKENPLHTFAAKSFYSIISREMCIRDSFLSLAISRKTAYNVE